MADLTVQNLSDEDGGAITFATAAGGGDKFVWDERAFLVIKNGDASSTNVTVTAADTVINSPTAGELTRSNIVLAVAAGATAIIPPLTRPFRNSADAGKVAITYSSATSLSVAAVRIR